MHVFMITAKQCMDTVVCCCNMRSGSMHACDTLSIMQMVV